MWAGVIISCHRNSQGSYGENLKLQSMRKTFQLAVASPKISIEQVWKDYSAFENVCVHILLVNDY